MGKRNRQEVTQTVNNDPWGPAQPAIKQGLKEAQNLYRQGPAEFYPGQTYAGLSDTTQNAISQMEGIAGGNNPWLGTALEQAGATARGDYLGEENPYLADLYARGAEDITNRTKSLYSGMGRYGSAPMQNELTDSLGGLYSSIYAPAYEAERNRQLQAAGMVPSLTDAQYSGADRLLSAGMLKDMDAQSQIDADRERWDYEQNADRDLLDWYNSTVMGTGSMGGTSTTTEPAVPFWQKLLGAGIGIAGMFR